MKILLSNDDGYTAKGIQALRRELSKFAEVKIVAPQLNCSGASNSLTLSRPVILKYSDSYQAYYVDGTPTDSVHIALTGGIDFQPDIVVSGINNGQNLGEDTLYSGTVAAAIEGAMFNLPSFAFSLIDKGWHHLEDAAKATADIVRYYIEHPLDGNPLFNINIPNLPYDALKNWAITRLGKRHVSQPAIRHQSPYGDDIFWIGAVGLVKDISEDTDFYAISQSQISITPLQLDLTHHQQLTQMNHWLSSKKGAL